MAALILPKLGFATRESTILRWVCAPGEAVQAGTPVLEVATEKTVVEVPAEESGTLLATFAEPGAIVPEGAVVGWIGADGEAVPPVESAATGWDAEVAPPPEDWQPPGSDAGAPASAAGTPQTELNKPYKQVLRQQIRKVTAERMAHSWQAPKVDLFAEVDFATVMAHREALKARGETAPAINVYIAHAVVRAFEAMPHLNCHWHQGRPVPVEGGIHVGVAVALGDNLVTVSLKDLAGISLADLTLRYRGMIRRAVGMSLGHGDLWGSSITLTSLGEFEVSAFTAVLNPPELFILAIGELKEQVVVKEGQITTTPMCTLCLSFDHRGVDGAPASRLLQLIKGNLERYE